MKNAVISIGGAFRTSLAIVASVSLCTLAVFPARAADYYWTGKEDSSFSNAANWSGNSVPPSSTYAHNIVLDDGRLTGNAVKTISLPDYNIAKMTVKSTGWTCAGTALKPLESGFYATSPNGTNMVFQNQVKATSRTFSVVSGGIVVFSFNPYLDGAVTWTMTGGGTFLLSSGKFFGGWSPSRAIKLSNDTVVRVGCGNPYSDTASGSTTWAGGTVTLQSAMSRLQLKNTTSAAQSFINSGKIVKAASLTNYNLDARDIGDGYVEIYLAPSGMPEITDASIGKDASGAFAVSAMLGAAPATLTAYADDGVNAPVATLLGADVAGAGTATETLSGLAADTTYFVYVVAESAMGSVTNNLGSVYNGVPQLTGVSSALELGLVPGTGTVSRASAADYPLVVNLSFAVADGAVEGRTFAAPVSSVTIPAGAVSASFEIVPLTDSTVAADSSVVATLAAGDAYLVPSVLPSATIGIVNSALPADRNVWVAAADGLASNGDNWSQGVPDSSSHVLFDGNFSNARCTWDSPSAVASWTQNSTYAGTVDIQTTYENGSFPVLAIAGDCMVNGGKWTHRANSSSQAYRLSVTVGGSFTVGAEAEITASNKGFAQNQFPAGSAVGVHGGAIDDLSKVYGNLKHPVDIGSGGASSGLTGGGAIHIVVAGSATVDGTLSARPNLGSGENSQLGAGGSIYLEADSVSGSGSINAAGNGTTSTRQDGAGGRIAVICTQAEELAFPKANFRCNGSLGGYGRTSGGGTVFVKTAAQQNGTLIVPNILPESLSNVQRHPTKRGVTPIPAGETWALDTIEFRGGGVLCAPQGTTLSVPLSGISATSGARTGGILYEGGTLDFGSAPYTLTGNWTFQADVPYTFAGDVMVSGGANIGCMRFAGALADGSGEEGATSDDYAVCDVTVDGDLTIAAGGYASVELGGPSGNRSDVNEFYPRHGGQYAISVGNKCYGSVFDPVLPGQFGQGGDRGTVANGGGALKLTVSGDLVVNGRVSADGANFGDPAAAAGSINIRANTISGSGTMSASGLGGRNNQWGKRVHGTGGRIAVRVAGEEVGTTGVWTSFAAAGCASNSATVAWNRNTSAGTIYLQGKSDGEKGGTIYVRNQKNYDTSNVATWIPAAERGDAVADFAKAKLVIADRGVVAIGAAKMKFAELTIEENSLLDLHGEYVRVKRATVGGTRLAGGKYTAATLPQFLADSGEGGVLDIGGGLSIVVR